MKADNKTLALALIVGMSFGQAMAQSEETDVLNSAPINVDGYLHEKPVTDAELENIKNELNKQKTFTHLNKEKAKELNKLSGQTEKLLESQEEYVDGRVESQQAINEYNKKKAENDKKLECLLNESTSADCAKWVKKKPEVVQDVVTTAQAAPAQVIEATAPVTNAPLKPFEEIKLLPYGGVTNFQGEAEKLETEFAGGLRLESNVTERFSMGVGINYGQFSTQDFANVYGNQAYGFGYNNAYGNAREINYSNIGVDLYGKFFITRGERFRPYIGAGLGYNRMSLEYADNSEFAQFGNNFGNEKHTSSYATGILTAGTEVLITRSVGLNVEFQYSRGFGGTEGDSGVNPFNAPDQRRLQELGDDIIQSNALSIFAGVLVVF